MTQEQKRIKLAEAAGWKLCREDNKTWRTPQQAAKNKKLLGHENGPWSFESNGPPDYFNDLNAVHLLELKVFQDSSIQLDYSLSLIRLIKNSSPLGKRFFSDFDLITATAAQRCEALGLTLGLWEAAK